MKVKYLLTILLVLWSECIIPQQSNLSKGVNYLSGFIAGDHFQNISSSAGDLALSDTLFQRALIFYDYDYSEALLSLTFALIPYKKVPIRIPLLNSIINYPLVSASDSIYNKKNENLPSKIFFDSPPDDSGDKDKLAHFFGAAFLSNSSLFFDLGDLIGYFVEAFEEDFKVQSSIDHRDLMTNKLGDIFGRLLKNNKEVLPSQVLIMHSLFYFNYGI
jgi:hypothetical protein